VSLQVTAIMLAVEDLSRAKKFYGEGMGCAIDKDFPQFVSFAMGDGSSLALYEREAAAQDAGVSAEGSGFRGVSLHYIVPSGDAVDEVISNAAAAGGIVVKPAAAAQWGGYFGYFSDPDGHLWKIVAAQS
jgi:predicted enzyme related to lactoylglutathione lyase